MTRSWHPQPCLRRLASETMELLINVTHPSNATYISDTENLKLVVFDGYSLVFYNGITHVKSGMEQRRLHEISLLFITQLLFAHGCNEGTGMKDTNVRIRVWMLKRPIFPIKQLHVAHLQKIRLYQSLQHGSHIPPTDSIR